MHTLFIRNAYEGEPATPDRGPYLGRLAYRQLPLIDSALVLGTAVDDVPPSERKNDFLRGLASAGFVVKQSLSKPNFADRFWQLAFERHANILIPINQIAYTEFVLHADRDETYNALVTVSTNYGFTPFDLNNYDTQTITPPIMASLAPSRH